MRKRGDQDDTGDKDGKRREGKSKWSVARAREEEVTSLSIWKCGREEKKMVIMSGDGNGRRKVEMRETSSIVKEQKIKYRRWKKC